MFNSTKNLLRSSLHLRSVIGKQNVFFVPSKCISCANSTRQMQSSGKLDSDNKSDTTINKKEVEHHTKLGSTWWNPLGPMKALHSLNELRVPFIRDGLVQCTPEKRTRTPLTTKKILDVGCGAGILSEALARLGARVTGIDASPELIGHAREHACLDPRLIENMPNYIHTSVEDHASLHRNLYDAVVASEIIEHVDNKELFIKSCIEALRPGGKMFITAPSRSRLTQVAGIYVAEYVLNLIPKGTHQYEKLPTPNELTFLLEKNDCHVEVIHGAFYNFITNKWSFMESTSLMIVLRAVKLEPSQS